LGKIAEQDDRIVLMGMNGFDDFLVSGEAAETSFDATVGDVFLDLGEEVVGDFVGWNVIGFEAGGRHIFKRSDPSLQKPQGWDTQIKS